MNRVRPAATLVRDVRSRLVNSREERRFVFRMAAGRRPKAAVNSFHEPEARSGTRAIQRAIRAL